ncbi:MAG: PDZ domain-containing protein [Acidobacteria bacterium]|nr:PDZ domain-containing protein [Acidobacteriota bacterium]
MRRHCSRLGAIAMIALAIGFASGATAIAQDAATDFDEMQRQAEELFFSARQPDSIAAFDGLINTLQVDADPSSSEWTQRLAIALGFRAQARFNLGDEGLAEDDLRRLLAAEPGTNFDPALVSPKFIEMFQALRDELVGQINVSLVPLDAALHVDGRRMVDPLLPIAVIAGDHTVDAFLLGHTSFKSDFVVEAGTATAVEITLERVSAVLTVGTAQPGVTVLLDGASVGETAADEGGDGGVLSFDNVMPGSHEIEFRRDNFRARQVNVEVADLLNYTLDPVSLEPARGEVILNGLPATAELRVNGEITQAPDGRLELVPGTHLIVIDGATAGVFEDSVSVVDFDRVEVDVVLRPTIRFLGVVGGDDVASRKIVDGVDTALGSGPWVRREQEGLSQDALASAGLPTDVLRVLAEQGGSGNGVEFAAAQIGLADAHPASVYMIAVLSDDLVATHADIWTFTAAPGPAIGDRLRIALETDDVAAGVADELLAASSFARAFIGAEFIDSLNASGAVVLSVAEAGPAATAGLASGDEVLAVDGTEVDGPAALHAALASADPGSSVSLRLADREISVALGASPTIVNPGNLDARIVATWIEISRLRAVGAPGVEPWVLALNEASILLRAGAWADAVRLLRATQFPERPGLGAGTASYWLALALSELGPDYADIAASSFAAAAADRTARLLHDDGPLIWPLARSRTAQ